MSAKLRLPTCAEWDTLAAVVGGDNRSMHWEKMFSWCQDEDPESPASRSVRGYLSAHYWNSFYPAGRYPNIGFRPVFEELALDASVPDGAIITAGTLYMGGQPVKVPENPISTGDISDYTPCARLELREALDDPAYQVRTIKAGGILISDRVMLKNINWADCYG